MDCFGPKDDPDTSDIFRENMLLAERAIWNYSMSMPRAIETLPRLDPEETKYCSLCSAASLVRQRNLLCLGTTNTWILISYRGKAPVRHDIWSLGVHGLGCVTQISLHKPFGYAARCNLASGSKSDHNPSLILFQRRPTSLSCSSFPLPRTPTLHLHGPLVARLGRGYGPRSHLPT